MKRELTIRLVGNTEQVEAHQMNELVRSLSDPDTAGQGSVTLGNGAVLSWDHTAEVKDDFPITEDELQAAARGPRITKQRMRDVERSHEFFMPQGGRAVVCALHLANGFVVYGDSAAISPENFNSETGKHYALQAARNEVGDLEGYLLRTLLHAQNDGLAVELGLRLDAFLSAELGDKMDNALATLGLETQSIGIVQQVLTDLWDITGRPAGAATEKEV